MEPRFRTKDLDRFEVDAGFDGGFARDLVRAYRKRLRAIRGATDERDLRAVKGNRFERLKGKRAHQHSMRLNDQWRLIIEITKDNPDNVVEIVSIEDYH